MQKNMVFRRTRPLPPCILPAAPFHFRHTETHRYSESDDTAFCAEPRPGNPALAPV